LNKGLPNNITQLLNKIVSNFRVILGDNLVGIYLHGSLAMGGYNPKQSDIDFLVVVKHSLTELDKRKIIGFTLRLSNSGKLPDKGLEFSVILETHAKRFVYPTPFELHFSKTWKERYERDEVNFSEKNKDKDLAAHITVTLDRGITLFGKSKDVTFDKGAKKFYKDSILSDVESFNENHTNPVYEILNLSRVLYYLKESKVASKLEGGIWILSIIPRDKQRPVRKAIDAYTNAKAQMPCKRELFSGKEVSDFDKYVMKLISLELDRLKPRKSVRT
jgi:predicted nucleotidyltransferase